MRRTGLKGLVAAGVVATGVMASGSPALASDMFLKIGNIQGESQDAKHKGEIDVLSWSWGQSTGAARTRRGPVPTACAQDLSFVKEIDSASPALIMLGVTGDVVPDAKLTVRSSGENAAEYLILQMTNVSVPSFQTGGSAGQDSKLTEQVVLHFESMKGEYRRQNPDGSFAGPPIYFEVSGACP